MNETNPRNASREDPPARDALDRLAAALSGCTMHPLLDAHAQDREHPSEPFEIEPKETTPAVDMAGMLHRVLSSHPYLTLSEAWETLHRGAWAD